MNTNYHLSDKLDKKVKEEAAKNDMTVPEFVEAALNYYFIGNFMNPAIKGSDVPPQAIGTDKFAV